MKTIIIILITIFFFISNNKSLCHDNNYVHRKIVMEAYKLLKLQLDKETSGFADMDDYIGNLNTDEEDTYFYEWTDITTVTGSTDGEDEADIIEFRDGVEGCNTSLNHFWLADYPNPNLTQRTIWLKFAKLVGGVWNFSAYTKGYFYIKGNFPKLMKLAQNLAPWGYGWYYYDGVPLYKLYSSECLYLHYCKIDYFRSSRWHRVEDCVEQDNGFCKKLFYNILGRTCHLLADMGVPEHINASTHWSLFHGVYGSAPLEHWLGEHNHDIRFHWTAEKVYEERGGFVNPFCELAGAGKINQDDFDTGLDNEHGFLWYTMSQISDYLAKWGWNWDHGNSTYDQSIGEIHSIINSYAPTEDIFLRHDSDNDDPNEIYVQFVFKGDDHPSGQKMRDFLIPYTIRATAGLLYKFIIESKMQFPDETDDKGTIFDQQEEVTLTNSQTLKGNYYMFRAEGNPGKLTVEPAADNEFIIESSACNVHFRGRELVFKPGFIAKKGSSVYLVSKDCAANPNDPECEQCLDPEDFNPQYDKSN